ncbi:hypothetical protein ACJRO7_017840 [Eucalyptus globulus]|uniref:ADP-ribosyl cyclase/cyclic ADP-ribose hydrolase n=1 Tax=Eucalyptus globulus TaxID=34317 RepID=A0ABD3KSV8_EUCGL
MKKMNALAVVLPLAPLSVYTYRLLRQKRSAALQNYDVFLSFRGPDTRIGFTDFLYKSLIAAGFRMFRDEDSIPFVQSKWCLRELTEIMDCHRKHGKSVFPVFYKVDVGDVRRQCTNFEKDLRKPKMQISTEEMERWWDALTSVARIKGWISQTIANGHEAELVKMVVAKVSSELKTMWIERLPMFIRSVHCQVFLAFRGPDTRHSLAAYLYISLVAAGIGVFNNDDPSLIDKDVDHEICNAIDHCKISIPILSKDCASSRWCLDELAQMVECKRTKRQKILPIFYKVRTSHVQDLSGVFGERMLKHEKMMNVLTSGVLVKEVIKEVSRLLKNSQTHDPSSLSTEY